MFVSPEMIWLNLGVIVVVLVMTVITMKIQKDINNDELVDD